MYNKDTKYRSFFENSADAMLIIENNEFVHASAKRGVIISSLNETYWSQRFRDMRRILK